MKRKGMLEAYGRVAGQDVVQHLRQLAAPLRGARVVHVNSTRVGGGVAEILHRVVPLMCELGLDARWEVISGPDQFYGFTKAMHNGLQGMPAVITESMFRVYEETNRRFAEQHEELLSSADFVFIHDPQPARVISFVPRRRGYWFWRCHIDLSRPQRKFWRYLRQVVQAYDASIFSMAAFAQPLDHVQYIIPPSIDPLSDKNRDLPSSEVDRICSAFGIDRERPILVQVSRFDAFKDPLGVIEAYRMVKQFVPQVQLVLAGGPATDDPEADRVLDETRRAANGDPDLHVLMLPPDAHVQINALQRAATVVLQKSLREGFGLTVTEAMWKGKPVIGGAAGGIKLQVVDHFTGFLVTTPEGAALRSLYLLQHEDKRRRMGRTAREFVKHNFLLTRHLREYLTIMVALRKGAQEWIVW